MKPRDKIYLILTTFYLLTQGGMTTMLFANSLVVMGIQDERAMQCSILSAMVLGPMYAIACVQNMLGRDARWYARSCIIVLAVALMLMLKGAWHGAEPTPQLLLGGWAVLLIIAALNGIVALVRAGVRRWL